MAASRKSQQSEPRNALGNKSVPERTPVVAQAELMAAVIKLASDWRMRLVDALAQCQLNDTRFAVLQAIAEIGPEGCSQTELAGALGNSESNISTLVDRMATDGLVERRRSAADRRKSLLLLSAAGRRMLAAGHGVYQRCAQGLLAGYPPARCRALTEQLVSLQQPSHENDTGRSGKTTVRIDPPQSAAAPTVSQRRNQQSRLP